MREMNVDDEDKVADVLDETNDVGSDSDEKIMLTTKEAGGGGGGGGGRGGGGGGGGGRNIKIILISWQQAIRIKV